MTGKAIDITGQKFSLLTVLNRVQNESDYNVKWRCVCECKNETVVRGHDLRVGRVRSCGCLRGETGKYNRRIHTPEYTSWSHMKGRCSNPKNKDYKDYNGRGIVVCERWFNSFTKFLEDMGKRPTNRHSIDRIDNNASYSCGHCNECRQNGWTSNCRWATPSEQVNNRRPLGKRGPYKKKLKSA